MLRAGGVARAEAAGGAKAATAAASGALSWEEQKKRANRLKQLPAKRDQVVAAIEAAEARKAAIHAIWCEPGYYEKTPPAEVTKLEDEEKELGPKIDALLAEWEALEAEIAEASLPAQFRCLQAAAREVGGRQIQNRGTVGGNLCNASPPNPPG